MQRNRNRELYGYIDKQLIQIHSYMGIRIYQLLQITDILDIQRYIYIGIQIYGYLDIQVYRYMGYTDIWIYGYRGIWICGYADIWVYEKMGIRVLGTEIFRSLNVQITRKRCKDVKMIGIRFQVFEYRGQNRAHWGILRYFCINL